MPRRKKKTKWTSCPDCGGDGDCGACDHGAVPFMNHHDDCRYYGSCVGECHVDTYECHHCDGSGKCTRCKGKGTVPLYPGRRR